MGLRTALTIVLLAAAWVRAAPAGESAEVAIAERLAKLARIALTQANVADDNFRQAAALLKAACRLDPPEPRFVRLLVEAQLQLKDRPGAVDSLTAYLKLVPNDQVARLQLVDLYLAQMETAEARLAYLQEVLLANEKLPAEFRASAAVRAARIYLDRDQRTNAFRLVARALELNPLDPGACELNWDRANDGTNIAEQVAALLAILRANPAQPTVMDSLGAVLANAGMHDASQRWYARSLDLAPRVGRSVDRGAFIDSAAGALVFGQAKIAESRAEALAQAEPDNMEAHLLHIVATRRLGSPETSAKALDQTVDALVARLNKIHEAVAGEPSPTTKPTGELAERVPDLQADATAVKEKLPDRVDDYAQGLADLAFITIFYANRPADAEPLISALRLLLPQESVVLTRLIGFQQLQSGRKEEATATLARAAQTDPLSQMALIRLKAEADPAAAKDEARTLLSAHRSGLLAAMLVDALASLDVRVASDPEVVKVVQAELAKFPMEWLDILDKPQLFYVLTASAGKVSFDFGEPILVDVTLKNTSNYDIPLGDGGTVHSDLWFDCTVKGAAQQQLPGAAFERFGQKTVLHRNELLTQQVRIDEGQLWAVMQSNPQMSFPLFYSVFTNPVPTAGISPGAAGYRYTLKTIERSATQLTQTKELNAELRKLTLGNPAERIRTAELFAQFASAFQKQENPPAELQSIVRQLREAVEQGMSDPDPLMRAWTTYVSAQVAAEPQKSQLVLQQSGETEWLPRLMAVVTAPMLAEEARQRVFEKLVKDEDEIVRDYAEATAEFVRRVPTTSPSNDATTQPAGPVGP